MIPRFVLGLQRARIALSYFRAPLANLARWLFASRELTNFTYDLDELNARHLAAMIADVTGQGIERIEAYLGEIQGDEALRAHVAAATRSSAFARVADETARYGRRVGWYAFARALKPATIVETGIDKGLGACVLAAALRRNREEGHPGTYYGTDIDPRAGYLFTGEYAREGRILVGDSIVSLRGLAGPIDLFINDSDHSADYEAREYEAVADKLSARAVILGDNAHVTDRLLEFARRTGRHFLFFREQPRAHWYPGAGIGIAFRR